MYIVFLVNMSIDVKSNFHSNRKHEFGYENWIWSFGIINSEKDGKSSKFIWTFIRLKNKQILR
jgi:hypothetical protein